MSKTASGTFELTWDQQPAHDTGPGAQIARATVTKDFTGGITGTSVAELITAVSETPESAGYVGIERVTGAVDGRVGSFVLQHSGISSAKTGQSLVIEVIPDSGTGDLVGLRGSLEIDPSNGQHTYELTYFVED